MYASFFGLRQAPFSIAPDPHYLFMSERHREALAHLLYGLGGGGGFVLLTGEIGAGKTTVCRCFLEQIPANTNVAYIFNPKLTVTELLQSICDEFHVGTPPQARTVKDFLDPLNRFLLAAHAAGKNNVLIIDEAQNLSAEVLEQLRLLTNLETAERKLLQIILIGQPELRDMLARPDLEQLAQRVIARCHLDALSEAETEQYIRHRLAVAGLQGAQPFQPPALRLIHRLTGGVPRRINLLCDRALLGAYASHQATVPPAVIKKAAAEVFAPPPRRRHAAAAGRRGPAMDAWGWGLATLAIGGGALALGLSAWAGWRMHHAGPATAGLAASAVGASSSASLPASSPASPPASAGSTAAASAPASVSAAASGAAPAAGPASASATAPVAGAAAHPAPPRMDARELETWMAQQTGDVGPAWQALAALWGQSPPPQVEPCAWLAQQGLQCSRTPGSSLPLIRQLDRPGWLLLHAGGGRAAPLLLLGLDKDEAWVALDGQPRRLALSSLAGWWRGEFATLWRTPPGYANRVKRPRALQDWALAQLGAAGQPVDSLPARVMAFQLAEGLQPDGLLGPLTLMQLNRRADPSEPRLQTSPLPHGN